jgi:HAD superfamily hydrolase (TIGR01509 family)
MSDAFRPRAVLFDSGGVLIRPIGGRWNPRADFEHIVTTHVPTLTQAQLDRAIWVGDDFLAASATTPDYDDYHRVMLRQLDIEPTAEILADLAAPVDPLTILEVFPDVLPTLRELRRRRVRMTVVSDAWPELPALHAALGIGEFFEAYAISAELGCHKPDPRMYHHASDALGLTPGECLFLDDDPVLVAAAIDLGYQGLAVLRGTRAHTSVPAISSLDAVLTRL